MQLLNNLDCQHISGGDTTVKISVFVPNADVATLATAMNAFMTGQLDAAAFAALLQANADNFNDMVLKYVSIGDFIIIGKNEF